MPMQQLWIKLFESSHGTNCSKHWEWVIKWPKENMAHIQSLQLKPVSAVADLQGHNQAALFPLQTFSDESWRENWDTSCCFFLLLNTTLLSLPGCFSQSFCFSTVTGNSTAIWSQNGHRPQQQWREKVIKNTA